MIPPNYCYATHAGKMPSCDNGCFEGCTCMQTRMRHLGLAKYEADKQYQYHREDYEDYTRRNACHKIWNLNKEDPDFQARETMFRNLARAEACGGDTARRTYLADGTVIRIKPRTHPQVYRSEGAKLGGLRTTLPSLGQFSCHVDCNPPVPCSTTLKQKDCIPASVRQGSLCCRDMRTRIPRREVVYDVTQEVPQEEILDADGSKPANVQKNGDLCGESQSSGMHSNGQLQDCLTPIGTAKCGMGCTQSATTGKYVESAPKYDAWRAKYLSQDPAASKKHQWFVIQQANITNAMEHEQNQRMDMWAREEACLTKLREMAQKKHQGLRALEQSNVEKALELQHDRDPGRTCISKNMYAVWSPAFEVQPATADLSSQPAKARFTEYREAARTMKTLLDDTKYNPGLLSRT